MKRELKFTDPTGLELEHLALFVQNAKAIGLRTWHKPVVRFKKARPNSTEGVITTIKLGGA